MSKTRSDLSLDGAQALLLKGISQVGSETVGLTAGLGRILRQELISDYVYPPEDVAELDGFCFRASIASRASAANPIRLESAGSIIAGARPGLNLPRGTYARIMTGALLPSGADAVVAAEEARVRGGCLMLVGPVKPGTHVRRTGSSVKVGDRLAGVGDVLTPARMGLLAACGVRRVKVARKVKIGIITTGDEIARAGARAKPWEIYGSNAVMLSGQAGRLGAGVVDLGVAADMPCEILERLSAGRRCDILVVSGGSSMGSHDVVLDAVKASGYSVIAMGIRLRPGGHLILARRARQILFGLPGRPAGCFMLFHLLVGPTTFAMLGSGRPLPLRTRAVWGGTAMPRPSTDTVLPVALDDNKVVRPACVRGGDLAVLARAGALMYLRSGEGRLKRGDAVEVYPLWLDPTWEGKGSKRVPHFRGQ
jgi:molybdopterin molybdotransferase